VPEIPAFLPTLLGMIAQAEAASQGPAGTDPVPASLAGVSRYVVNKAMTKLIQDGEAAIPSLHDRLVRDGVVLPDREGSGYYGGYDDYDDHGHGYRGRGYYGYGGPTREYRESYKLGHIRLFGAALQELGGAAAQGQVTPQLIEYLTRAGASLEPLANAGQLAGMMEGGTPAELAAEALFPTLKDGVSALGERFLFRLREAGLAPAVGDKNSVLGYAEALTPEQLQAVRGVLMERVRSGQGWNADGTARPLTWNEKVYLAKALIKVDEVIRGGPATAAGDDAFFASIAAPGEESIALARIKAAMEGRSADAAFLLRAETALLQRVAAAPNAVTAEDLAQVLNPLFAALAAQGQEERAWVVLAEALAADPNNDGLKLAVRSQVNATTRAIAEQGRGLLGNGFDQRLFSDGVMSDANSFRGEFNQRHIRALQQALEAEKNSSHGPGTQAARRIIPHLDAGYRKFPGQVFLEELRPRGFALNNGQTGIDSAYPDRYSRKQVEDMLAWARQYRAAGVTRDGYGPSTRPMDAEERQIMNALIAELESVLAAYPATDRLTPAQREALMSPAERALYARAALLERVAAAAAAAGVSRGDATGEMAAKSIPGWLHRGYQLWPGSVFLEDMRAQGFALNNGVTDRVNSYPSSYSRAEVQRLHDYLQAYKAAGVTRSYNGGGTRALNDREKELLDQMIAEVGRTLREYPAAGAPAQPKRFYGGALLPFLAAAPVLPVSWLLAGGLLLAAAFAAWAFWALKGPAEELKDAPSLAESGRFQRLEVAAQRLAKSAQWGAFRSRAKGDGGLEYAESRDFEPGDTLRDVDWTEYAQTGELRTKVFDQEREMPLMLVVDLSKSGAVGTQGVSKSRLIEDVAATLAFTAGRTNMRVGAVLFTDRVEAVIPPAGGRAHAWRVAQAIAQAQPEGRATDIRAGLDAAVKSVKTRAIVTVLSDFLSDADFKDALASAGARHDLRLIRVADPVELRPLPEVGLVPVADAETGAARVLDTSALQPRRDAAAAIARREARIEDAFASVRTQPIVLSTEGDPLEELALHFQPKTKKPIQPD
jgi:hypothetical protein